MRGIKKGPMDQLPRQMDMFEAVFSAADVGIAVLGPEGIVHRANDALGRFLKKAPDSLEGLLLSDCFYANEREEDARRLASIRSRESESVRSEVRFVRSDGRSIYGLVTYAAVREHGGVVERVVAVIDDITAEKDALRRERDREQAVRRAYADVVAAMTGGRILILPHEELPDQLGERVLGPIEFHKDAEPGEIRHLVREYVKTRGDEVKWDDGFEVAMGEALLNALKHGGGGRLSLHEYGKVLQAVIEDDGSGIDFSAIATATVEGGYPAAHTLGVGFTLILSFTSRIMLATGPTGTTVVLEGHDGGPDRTLPG